MKIIKPLLITVFTVLACSLVACSVSNGDTTKKIANDKYNLLFIMVDQMRFDAMSQAGNTILHTQILTNWPVRVLLLIMHIPQWPFVGRLVQRY